MLLSNATMHAQNGISRQVAIVQETFGSGEGFPSIEQARPGANSMVVSR